jgi:hypothetical protein
MGQIESPIENHEIHICGDDGNNEASLSANPLRMK